jgi:hypothetical protein
MVEKELRGRVIALHDTTKRKHCHNKQAHPIFVAFVLIVVCIFLIFPCGFAYVFVVVPSRNQS